MVNAVRPADGPAAEDRLLKNPNIPHMKVAGLEETFLPGKRTLAHDFTGFDGRCRQESFVGLSAMCPNGGRA
jgi:hypothetical protein